MSSSEMRAWVIDRALVRQRALVLSVPEASWGQGLRLRVEIDEAAMATAEEELADLMMDMRLLGLSPEVLTADEANGSAEDR
jgi:hypothetical protein